MFSATALAGPTGAFDSAAQDHSGRPRPAPSRTDRAYFLLGQSSAGLWVVRDKANRRGGVFVSQQDALKYIRHETDPRGQFVVVYLPSGLELDPT